MMDRRLGWTPLFTTARAGLATCARAACSLAARLVAACLFAACLFAARAAAQTPADSAWIAGDLAMAERLYSDQLADDPDHQRALHRLALIRAWTERYDESLELFGRLLELAPENLEAARDRARILAWRGELDASIASFDSLVARHPQDRDARLGLARVLSWADRLEEAEEIYAELLSERPEDRQALAGYARMAAWSGDLLEAETRWRAALERHPSDPMAQAGLGRTLHWQGRHAAALPYLRRAAEAPGSGADVLQTLRAAEAAVSPRAAPVVSYVSDSDGNRIGTARLEGTAWIAGRLALRVRAYGRSAERDPAEPGPDPTSTARSYGGVGELEYVVEPGWRILAGGGATRLDRAEAETIVAYRFSLETPRRNPVGLSLGFDRRPIDETVQLIESATLREEWRATLRLGPFSGFRAVASGATAEYEGSASNRRLAGSLGLFFRPSREWDFGVRFRGFGFEEDRDDGYFDPSFYGIGELQATWSRLFGDWRLGAQLAPGLQEVRRVEAEMSPTLRGAASVGLVLGPATELALRAVYSSTGLNSFATGDADYRYLDVSLSASIGF